MMTPTALIPSDAVTAREDSRHRDTGPTVAAKVRTTDEARQLNNRRPARVGRARGEVMLNNRMSLEKWRRDG